MVLFLDPTFKHLLSLITCTILFYSALLLRLLAFHLTIVIYRIRNLPMITGIPLEVKVNVSQWVLVIVGSKIHHPKIVL